MLIPYTAPPGLTTTWKTLFWKQHRAVCLGLNLREQTGTGQYLDSSTQHSLQLWGTEQLL